MLKESHRNRATVKIKVPELKSYASKDVKQEKDK